MDYHLPRSCGLPCSHDVGSLDGREVNTLQYLELRSRSSLSRGDFEKLHGPPPWLPKGEGGSSASELDQRQTTSKGG